MVYPGQSLSPGRFAVAASGGGAAAPFDKVAGGEMAPRLLQTLLNDVGDNPDHLPVMVMIEIKTQSVPDAAAAEGAELALDLPWTIPLPTTPELLDALDATNWNVSAAARRLRIPRHHLRYRMQKYGLKKPKRA